MAFLSKATAGQFDASSVTVLGNTIVWGGRGNGVTGDTIVWGGRGVSGNTSVSGFSFEGGSDAAGSPAVSATSYVE